MIWNLGSYEGICKQPEFIEHPGQDFQQEDLHFLNRSEIWITIVGCKYHIFMTWNVEDTVSLPQTKTKAGYT